MQKKLIALALASLAGTAFAQSNVTIYGVADATYDYVGAGQSTAATAIKTDGRVSTNSSYIGFKGAEDLGNGLKAVFQYESGAAFDNVGALTLNRDSFVGLAGSFGTVVAGNVTAAARGLGAKVDVNAGATGVGYQGALYGRIGGTVTGVDDRTANAIAYVSPNFSGFSGVVAWGAGSENKQATVANPGVAIAGTALDDCGNGTVAATGRCTNGVSRVDNVYSLGLNYENGPIYVGYAYTEVDSVSGAAQTKAIAKSNRLGGMYKFSAGQVGILWDSTDADTKSANNKRNVYILNGKFNVTGNGAIIAGWGKANNVDGRTNTDATHMFVGYEHSLSKRTILKAVYSTIKNDSGVAYNYYNGATGAITGLVAGQDPHALQIGVRHSF